MRKVDKIVVHCSDSPDARDSVDAAVIRAWHIERGFTDIGYHAVVLRDGVIEKGRPEAQLGAHCQGHNKGSLGICWVGRDDPTDKQEASLVNQVADWCVQYNLDTSKVYGHRELAPIGGKTCPNISMSHFRVLVATRIRALKNN